MGNGSVCSLDLDEAFGADRLVAASGGVDVRWVILRKRKGPKAVWVDDQWMLGSMQLVVRTRKHLSRREGRTMTTRNER
jgi:hypothetical protein